eukprot:scaffold13289_cov59-Phaeocystis_antarctica.AAC.3
MHRRTTATIASAASTSPPERPPPSPAAAQRASRTTTSAPTHNSTCPLASQSTRAASSRSLLCVPAPLHPRVVASPPAAAHPPLTRAPQARTTALQGVVPAATHRAAGLLLAQRVLASDASTGATTTLAGSGVQGVKDDDVGTNARFYYPIGIAIDPSGTFALVAVRAWPPAPRTSWPSHAAARLPLTHAPDPHCHPLGWCSRATPRRRLAPRAACARARCTAGDCQQPHPPCRHQHWDDHHPRRQCCWLQGR